jgi:hypothetical protein
MLLLAAISWVVRGHYYYRMVSIDPTGMKGVGSD